ncbi:hypothetical protein AQ865_20365 [Burkholderia pseudomallei]|uniref:hypothetical protein n=1 Tax=Burkholderia pseudomallei TaxID=28450 RepID=UPI0009CC7DC7|nr:hypothetical protein [Burkholderia pseudomallei]OMZ55313.1 hypothetical protein AQ865_20365 [Burkholderia pseudomallei]
MNDQQQSRADELTRVGQFLTDVVTAAGLLSHGRTDKKLATRISDGAFELQRHIHYLAASPVSQHDNKPAAAPADERAAFVKVIGYERPDTDGVAQDAWDSQRATWLEALEYARAAASPAAEAVAWVRKHPDTGELSGDWLWNDAIEQCRKASGVWFPLGFLGARPALPEEPAAIHQVIHQVWVEETSSWADVTPAYYAERQPSNRRRVYYAPQPAPADAPADVTLIPYDGLTEEFTDEVARLANDAPGIREAVAGALQSCGAIIAPADAPAHAAECPHCDGEGVIEADSGASPCACAQDAQEGMPTFGARRTQADAPAEAREIIEPLTEPVTIRKALLAGRTARVVLSGGDGPAAAVHLVNIGLTGWVHTKETAEAYAKGFNQAAKWMQNAMRSAPADAGEAVAHMRVRSTDAGSTRHAIDIAPEAAALDLKPGEYLLYLAPPTTRAAHLTTTLSPDQRISMAAKLFCFANELLNGADQS